MLPNLLLLIITGAERESNAFLNHVKERNVSQEERLIAFDNQETMDDHGMHVTGLVEDQKGTKYFIVKNSWGESNELDGYFFASFPYVKYKTLNILVHKDALDKDLIKKLGINNVKISFLCFNFSKSGR